MLLPSLVWLVLFQRCLLLLLLSVVTTTLLFANDLQMIYVVELYVGGTVFKEEVQATNPKDARETALARNPKAKVIGVNVRF